MIRTVQRVDLDSDRYCVNAEIYNSSTDMLKDLKKRKITDSRFHDVRNEKLDACWCGVKTYNQALELLGEGYSPAVTQIYKEIKTKSGRSIDGINSGFEVIASVEGYQPIVPLTLCGIPNNMLTRKVERIESRVFNLFIDTTCVSTTTIDDLVLCGIQLIKFIYNMEMCGHKINLYMCEAFAGEAGADLLCIKTKNSSSPLDLKRISFPLCHTAFTRVICFDWYSKFPLGVYRKRYGTTLINAVGKENADRLMKKLFGAASLLVTYEELKTGGEAYLRQALEIGKVITKKNA